MNHTPCGACVGASEYLLLYFGAKRSVRQTVFRSDSNLLLGPSWEFTGRDYEIAFRFSVILPENGHDLWIHLDFTDGILRFRMKELGRFNPYRVIFESE